MHPEIRQNLPGFCPKCGMKLILESEPHTESGHGSLENSYKPVFIIIALITLTTIVFATKSFLSGTFMWKNVMMNFMAGFFLVFSGFKLIDVKGFAEGYSSYDLLAQKVFSYGYIYPFIELILGLLFALHFSSPFINFFTFLLMTFSGAGVAIKIARHEKFQCACLGTFLKVPLTKVTLLEDFGMATMAFIMLFVR